MNITIAGVHMETGAALQHHTEEKAAVLAQHFDKIIDVHAAFVQEPHHHHLHGAELTVQASGNTLHAKGQGIDFYAALDDATEKLVRQLDKYKGRLGKQRERQAKFKEHLRDMGPMAFEEAHLDEATLDAAPTDIFAEFAPNISRKEVTKVAAMSIDEAVMQMDLLHKPAYLFMNAKTGVLNMVYREGDNAVRWIAPKGGM
jgi:putative sigma-54 modulation protein